MQSRASYSLKMEGNIIFAKAQGSWDIGVVNRFVSDFKKQVLLFRGQPWAHVADLRNWTLGTPEIEPEVQALVDWCITQNLRRAAHVYSPDALKSFQIDRMVKTAQGNFIRCQFDDLDQAVAWIESQGFYRTSTAQSFKNT